MTNRVITDDITSWPSSESWSIGKVSKNTDPVELKEQLESLDDAILDEAKEQIREEKHHQQVAEAKALLEKAEEYVKEEDERAEKEADEIDAFYDLTKLIK